MTDRLYSVAEGAAPAPVFSVDEAQRAFDDWGANCGPGALAAVAGVTLQQAREWIGVEEFAGKRYTNPTMMLKALTCSGLRIQQFMRWPQHGLVRVQWEGPWMRPGVPMRARYRYTHWVGSHNGGAFVFDINCMSVGGWVPRFEWESEVVPWLLRTLYPRADGKWHITHGIEVESRR